MKRDISADHAYWGRIIERLERLGRSAQVQEERRRSKRYGYGRWVGLVEVVYDETSNNRIWVQGRNLSREGFGFLHVRVLQVAGQITVMLKALDGEVVPNVAEIVRCHEVEEGIWEVGVKFISPIKIDKYVMVHHGDADHNP